MYGVKIRIADDVAEAKIFVQFECEEADAKVFCLEVAFDKTTEAIRSAELTPSGENVAGADVMSPNILSKFPAIDILMEVQSVKEISFLFEEIWARISNCWALKNQLRQLTKSFQYIHSVDTKEEMHRLAMNLPGRMECELWLSLDFPLTHAKSVQIRKVSCDKNKQISAKELEDLVLSMKVFSMFSFNY